MWELGNKKVWMPKNWCLQTMVLEMTLENPLASKEIKPVNPKGNQSWIIIGRIDAEAEARILWPPDEKRWLAAKDTDAEKDWRQEKKVMTENGMVGWPHQLIINSLLIININLSKLWEMVKDREAWSATVHGVTKSWTWLSNSNELNVEPIQNIQNTGPTDKIRSVDIQTSGT